MIEVEKTVTEVFKLRRHFSTVPVFLTEMIPGKKLFCHQCIVFQKIVVPLHSVRGEIPKPQKSIRYYFALSQEPRKLYLV